MLSPHVIISESYCPHDLPTEASICRQTQLDWSKVTEWTLPEVEEQRLYSPRRQVSHAEPQPPAEE